MPLMRGLLRPPDAATPSMIATAALLALGSFGDPPLAGSWRAVLEQAGGPLRFAIVVEANGAGWRGRLCNGPACEPLSGVRLEGDSVAFEIAGYAAAIVAGWAGDSLIGTYRNVGRRGPRTIPFHASRGSWPVTRGPESLLGRWDAWFHTGMESSPRIVELRNGRLGLEGTVISGAGDYGHFAGVWAGDSFALSHFDGSYVYRLTGRLDGDTLRGTFHAGLRSQTPFTAVRSTGGPHLRPLAEITRADSARPFRFAFPDLDGRLVSSADPRFRGKVVLVDLFGTWCPNCHDAAPHLVRLYRDYHARGLEIVGLAYEVTGDTAQDARQVRRYRDKFGIAFPLLLAGTSENEAVGASLPQLEGFGAFPTTIFLDRTGRVRRIQAGFYGPATGAEHERLVAAMRREVEALLAEPDPAENGSDP